MLEELQKKPLTPEKLMQPRYKVIADYPFQSHKIGDIISCYESAHAYLCEDGDNWNGKECMSDYPALFRELQWYEERAEGDMPHYVKVIKNAKGFGLPDNCVREVNEWRMDLTPPRADCFPMTINAENLFPATIDEYTTYNQSQK